MLNNCILVVDDELRMRKLIKDFLAAKGYSILEAEDGEKGLEEASANSKVIFQKQGFGKTHDLTC